MIQRSTACDQGAGSVAGGQRWQLIGEQTDECNAGRLVIVTGRMGSLASPATTLVHLTVSADQEVVADVSPTVGVHVEVLDVTHLLGTSGLGGAGGTGRMMDDGKRCRTNGQDGGVGRTRSPFCTGNNAWAA